MSRFDGELVIAREDAREERQLREKLQGERDRLVSEKYSFEQSVHTLQHEHQSALEKADRADKDLRDILTSGKDTSEVRGLCEEWERDGSCTVAFG